MDTPPCLDSIVVDMYHDALLFLLTALQRYVSFYSQMQAALKYPTLRNLLLVRCTNFQASGLFAFVYAGECCERARLQDRLVSFDTALKLSTAIYTYIYAHVFAFFASRHRTALSTLLLAPLFVPFLASTVCLALTSMSLWAWTSPLLLSRASSSGRQSSIVLFISPTLPLPSLPPPLT